MKAFTDIEKDLDSKLEQLALWELTFQQVMSQLLLQIETIELRNQGDTAMDYTSRLSYVYNTVRERSQHGTVVRSVDALISIDLRKYIMDINFLNAYAHYAMLMPQFHRGTLKVETEDENHFTLGFGSQEIEHAEVMDRIYSYLSQQAFASYPTDINLENHFRNKATNGDSEINANDLVLIRRFFMHYRQYNILIQTIPDDIFKNEVGVTFQEYKDFCASVLSWCQFFNKLGRAFHDLVGINTDEQANIRESIHIDWSVCCLEHTALEGIRSLSGLDDEAFRNLFSFYLTKYTDITKEGYEERAFCGDAFFPPFTWMDDTLLFSSTGTKFMLPINNILYSINKKNSKQFDEKISSCMEPVLVKQIQYLFSFLPDTISIPNVNYNGGEIDLIILSKKESVAICFQIKATIAPDSARTVKRVEDRAMEGIKQLIRFEELSDVEKTTIINKEFGTTLTHMHFIHLLCVRSSAGSAGAWTSNSTYPILNYVVLANLIAGKIEKRDFSIKNLKMEILLLQQALLASAIPEIVTETLLVDEYQVTFPNVHMNNDFMLSTHVQILKNIPDYEVVPT